MSRRTVSRALLTALAVLLVPVPSDAHLMTTGLGPVYDGLSHFVLTPEDLLPAVALALLAGQRGVRAGRLVLFALPVSWLAGGLLGLALPALHAAPWLAAIGFVALGGLVAAEARIGPAGVAGLAAALGLVHGAGNGAAMAAARLGGLGLVGIVVALFVVVALTAARVASLRAAWARVAVRVAGSWIVAVGLLLLGWSLRGAG